MWCKRRDFFRRIRYAEVFIGTNFVSGRAGFSCACRLACPGFFGRFDSRRTARAAGVRAAAVSRRRLHVDPRILGLWRRWVLLGARSVGRSATRWGSLDARLLGRSEEHTSELQSL